MITAVAITAARRWCTSGGLLAAALLVALLPGVADAARPTKNTPYDGQTSQGKRIGFFATRPNLIDNAETYVRLACTHAGRLRFDAIVAYIHVRRDGSFSSTYYDGRDPEFDRLTRGGTTGLDIIKLSMRDTSPRPAVSLEPCASRP